MLSKKMKVFTIHLPVFWSIASRSYSVKEEEVKTFITIWATDFGSRMEIIMKECIKKEYVSKILGTFLRGKGFVEEYFAEDVDGAAWFFKKNVGNEKIQTIEIIDKSRYSLLRFYIDGERRKYTISDLDESYLKSKNDFLDYSNEEEFSSMITYYRELIDQTVLDFLNKIDVTKKTAILTLEHYDYIKYNNTRKWRQFKDENKGKNAAELILIIKSKIIELQSESFENVVWKLLDIICIYGNWVIDNYGGNWSKFGKGYGISNVGPLKRPCNPCNDIIKMWTKEFIISIEVLEQYYGENAIN